MKRMAIAAVGLALVTTLLAAHGSSVQAQPVASITLPEPGGTEQLYTGCNNIGLTFQDGTSSDTVVIAVAPSGAVQAMWRHNAALNMFEGFAPTAPQASDLLTVDFLDAVWICVAGAPASTSPPPPVATAPPASPTTYIGTHAAGGTVKFTVSPDGREVEYFVGKGFCGLQTNELWFPTMRISGNHFYAEAPYYDRFRVVSGTIQPLGEASGIINFGYGCHGDVPWTAYVQ